MKDIHANIGCKTLIAVTSFCVLGLLWVYFVLPDLEVLTLEEIDAVFADEASAEDRIRRERIAKELGVRRLTLIRLPMITTLMQASGFETYCRKQYLLSGPP
jgi:hypothetical protein